MMAFRRPETWQSFLVAWRAGSARLSQCSNGSRVAGDLVWDSGLCN
jgi:hypothetical protein